MEKRYYYSDPLTAAWVKKNFGIAFNREGYPDKYKEDFSDWHGCGLSEVMHKDGFGKFYIHADSLHLLDEMPETKKVALKELNMWPECE